MIAAQYEDGERQFEPLVNLDLKVDTDEVDRGELRVSSGGIIDDTTIDLFRRANRIGLARAAPIPVPPAAAPPGRSVVDVPLLFALHAHPECRYEWARLIIDLSSTVDAVIADMSPRDVQDVAVDVETRVGASLTLAVVAKAVDITAKPEVARKRTVFFPLVSASGTGFRQAFWDFHAKAGDYLHADKELHLLVNAPAGVPVTASITARASVRFRGLARRIPLLGHTGGIDAPRLVRLA